MLTVGWTKRTRTTVAEHLAVVVEAVEVVVAEEVGHPVMTG